MSKDSFEQRALAAQTDALPWAEAFLAEYVKTHGDIDAAAESVHVIVPEVFRAAEVNKPFAAAWKRAKKTSRDMKAESLEQIAYHEAAFPRRKYRFTPQGDPINHPETGEPYYETERDNRLVMSLLKALDRDTYADRQIVTGEGGGAIQHEHTVHTLADIVRIAGQVEAGQLSPETVVGEILDAEIVSEKPPIVSDKNGSQD